MKKHLLSVFLILSLLISWSSAFAFSCEKKKSIIQMPIEFNVARIQYTKDYMLTHYGIKSKTIEIIPKMIVIHWTSNATLLGSFNTFKQPTLSKNYRSDLPDKLNLSAHYLVARDGAIYQLMPDNWMARHVIGLNYNSIGIENVGGVDDKADLTEKQVESNAYLVCYLRKKYPTIQYVIGHYQYLNFKQTPLWLEKNPNYQTVKADPGEGFMVRVKKLSNIKVNSLQE